MPNAFLNDILTKAERLHAAGETGHAAELYRQVLQLDPSLSRTAYNLGIILNERQDYPGAEAAFSTCLSHDPNLLEAKVNLAFTLQEQGRIQEAFARYQAILRTDPGCIEARFNLACLQLLLGNFGDGLQGYELRFATSDPVHDRHRALPLWDGSIRPGLRLLIHAEQGYGDTIQMLRYLPKLLGEGLDITLEVPSPLMELCSRLTGINCVERGKPLPPVACRLPIMSLPLVTGTTLTTIPAAIPYLSPDPGLVRHWKRRLPDTTRLRVGLAWSGRFDLPVNRKRSCPADLIQQLLEIERVDFISLQPAPTEGFQLHDRRLADYGAELTDFHQTAALIANLDLVIAIDTAVAHLAGALGIPTWLMLPAVPDWRWFLERQDSPWYPSMRLFRQPRTGAWQTVIDNIHQELTACCSPRIWSYRVGQDFDGAPVGDRPTPLTDRTGWPELGIWEAAGPEEADWLLFPFYLEYLTESRTVEGMWQFLEQLPWFEHRQEQHLLFSDHDCTAPYHSSASWFRASIAPHRQDTASTSIPYQVCVPKEHLHFDPARIRYHVSFIGYLGLLRDRTALINGLIAEPRLVHELDLSTSFHLHLPPDQQTRRWRRYLETSSASCCVLCPRGDGSSSRRFYETMALGRIAVIQEPMLLAFTDRIDYDRFVIRIPQDQPELAGTIIYEWLAGMSEDELIGRCREARAAWERHLAPEALPAGIIRSLCRRRFVASSAPSLRGEHPATPSDWRQKLNRGAACLLEGGSEAARQELLAALHDNPRSTAILLLLAGAAEALNAPDEAETWLLDALQYDHRCYDAYLMLAGLLARNGRPTEAVGRLYQASLLRPDDEPPYRLAIPLLLQLGRHDEADWCNRQLARLAAEASCA